MEWIGGGLSLGNYRLRIFFHGIDGALWFKMEDGGDGGDEEELPNAELSLHVLNQATETP